LERESHNFKQKTQRKPHANHYKSLYSMKVGFVSYARNFSLNTVHLKYIIKFEKAVVLHVEQRLFCSVAAIILWKLQEIIPDPTT